MLIISPCKLNVMKIRIKLFFFQACNRSPVQNLRIHRNINHRLLIKIDLDKNLINHLANFIGYIPKLDVFVRFAYFEPFSYLLESSFPD